ncbi:hypothetical protein ACFO3A_03070 [Comamonas nitrativorans]|uniref:Uncharacterized protein n=1 Tax=Comamonas nitrativorans TaxID=108437 RepID=A0ABV9GT73_9BURK
MDDRKITTAEAYWRYGDWGRLIDLYPDSGSKNLDQYTERAQLAVYAAAGHLQRGQIEVARELIRLAQEWGVGKSLLGNLLVSGIYNNFGVIAELLNKSYDSYTYFENSVKNNLRDTTNSIAVRIRRNKEFFYLNKKTRAGFGNNKSLERNNNLISENNDANQKFNLNIYINKTKKNHDFLLINSKSLPRSGLHYLEKTLSQIFGECFSFCELYQEPGCCKQFPCALTGFMDYSFKNKMKHVRLIKSHDFGLSDPIFENGNNIRQLVLIRAPLFILTSWFELYQLQVHKEILSKFDIKLQKIYYRHEKQVLEMANEIIDAYFAPSSTDQLTSWLDEKVRYANKFIMKYTNAEVVNGGKTDILLYEDIDRYAKIIVNKLNFKKNHDAFLCDKERFKARSDPFTAKSLNITNYLIENSNYFIRAAEKIKIPETSCIPWV